MNSRTALIVAVIVWWILANPPASAQLAITEVMSAAAGSSNGIPTTPGPDFWELTNFGTKDHDLTGYRFSDGDGGMLGADDNPFSGLVIRGHESIVFFESKDNVISAASFRAWWGLESSVRVIAYTNTGFGLSGISPGDGVRLWSPGATSDADVVDSVDFGPAVQGFSFTYDALTGEWGALSSPGVGGAFRARSADDIGSPGANAGPVQLKVVEPPASVLANPGDSVSFSIKYHGLPRPVFQWFHDGNSVPAGRSAEHVIVDAQPSDAGEYRVVLSNAFQVVTSAPATLTLGSRPVPPVFIQSPQELWVYSDQEAAFRAVATGLPQPAYQWQIDGTDIPGATGRTLIIPAPHPIGTNVCSVVVSNPLGSVTNTAGLVVTERPDLRITELMAIELPSTNHQDWWEVTNFGPSPVDLFGCRFDDFSDIGGQAQAPRLAFAWTLTEHVIIQPGESIVFVESMAPEAFRRWWGGRNLPPALRIITYPGAGLGFSGTRGDGIGLWNMGAMGDDDVVNGAFTLVSYSAFDLPNAIGVSFAIDPAVEDELCCYRLSQVGVNGAFAAAEGGDVGSPGYVRAATDPRVQSIIRVANGWRLTWRSVISGDYLVQSRSSLSTGTWEDLTTLPSVGDTTSFVDSNAGPGGQRFYRVVHRPSP